MFAIHRILQWLIIVVVVLSDLLLGMAHHDYNISLLAPCGWFCRPFVVVDWMKWFHLRPWMAKRVSSLCDRLYCLRFLSDPIAQSKNYSGSES